MLPYDEAVFVAHVRRLDPSSRGAFLADVLRAAGNTVEDRDGAVVQEDGTRVTVGVRTDAGEATPQILDARELAELVAYGLSEGAARECCERHLGAPPSKLEAPARLRVRRRVHAVGPAVRPALTLLVVFSMLFAIGLGTGAPAADSPDAANASGATAVQERFTEQSVPPAPEYGEVAKSSQEPQSPAITPEDSESGDDSE